MPDGSAEKTCSAKMQQGAWIPTSIVLCVLHLPPRMEQANTFINTSAVERQRRGRRRAKAQGKAWFSVCGTKESVTNIRRVMFIIKLGSVIV